MKLPIPLHKASSIDGSLPGATVWADSIMIANRSPDSVAYKIAKNLARSVPSAARAQTHSIPKGTKRRILLTMSDKEGLAMSSRSDSVRKTVQRQRTKLGSKLKWNGIKQP